MYCWIQVGLCCLCVGARLCAFVRLCLHARYFGDIRVSLCACVYCAPGRLSAAALAASRSRRIREAAPTPKNGADLFASGSAFVSSSARIRRESHESCVSRESERELDQIKGNLGTGLPPIPTREGKNDGI